jgi:hypothetical protein
MRPWTLLQEHPTTRLFILQRGLWRPRYQTDNLVVRWWPHKKNYSLSDGRPCSNRVKAARYRMLRNRVTSLSEVPLYLHIRANSVRVSQIVLLIKTKKSSWLYKLSCFPINFSWTVLCHLHEKCRSDDGEENLKYQLLQFRDEPFYLKNNNKVDSSIKSFLGFLNCRRMCSRADLCEDVLQLYKGGQALSLMYSSNVMITFFSLFVKIASFISSIRNAIFYSARQPLSGRSHVHSSS